MTLWIYKIQKGWRVEQQSQAWSYIKVTGFFMVRVFLFFVAELYIFLCQSSPVIFVIRQCEVIYQPQEMMVVLPVEDCPVYVEISDCQLYTTCILSWLQCFGSPVIENTWLLRSRISRAPQYLAYLETLQPLKIGLVFTTLRISVYPKFFPKSVLLCPFPVPEYNEYIC